MKILPCDIGAARAYEEDAVAAIEGCSRAEGLERTRILLVEAFARHRLEHGAPPTTAQISNSKTGGMG